MLGRLTIEVRQVQGKVVVLIASRNQDASLRCRIEYRSNAGHGVHEDAPVTKGDDDQRNRDEQILVPDSNRAEPTVSLDPSTRSTKASTHINNVEAVPMAALPKNWLKV
jgi:hypothetical protein